MRSPADEPGKDLELVAEAVAGTHVPKRYAALRVDHINARHFAALDDRRHRDQEAVRLADDEADFDVHAGREIERPGRQVEARPKRARRRRGLRERS